ncbi:M1 family peptidase [Brumimicrobium glaciale]|uniref:Aminopeptidase N n=1 Tax=Brumimicrobium glaciale TaxID=200475 RepID=A0A4Q4KI32_9FLAO|nr:M1 family metallopeptidase [Brumimicrobium glaciale]RYM32508.1 M1 family peptidase [Brumimicrobium glaciale]
MIKKIFPVLAALALFSCNQEQKKEQKEVEIKTSEVTVTNHSYSKLDEVKTLHLNLELSLDVDKKIIEGIARHRVKNAGFKKVYFDIKDLNIEKVTLGDKNNEYDARFEIGEYDSLLGSPLIVDLDIGDLFVNIYYSTSPSAEALGWLAPELTGSGKYPFLYTQGQAILTRSWIPVQDTPENRITYSATVKVPEGMLPLMSATNPTELNESGVYHFEMKQPIPSYLLALTVGELEYRKLSDNSGVYAEPHMIDAAEKEFKDIPKMIDAAEGLYGDYLWDIYDVVVLPYSFPFGGMENPRLTFVTPTLIAGDGSLVSTIAHELAHSWSGNLVTNASWDDFWLNEGFTVYFENRIMEEVYGKEVADMLAIIELQELKNTISEMNKEGNQKDTHLKLNLDNRNPDDGMTDIAYGKGSFFLKTIESKVGREKFDVFINGYFNAHKFETLTTEDFVNYLNKNLPELSEMGFNTEEWIYGAGIPDNIVKVESKKFEIAEQLASDIKEGKNLPKDLKRKDKTTQEWMAFIRGFNGELEKDKMIALDKQLNFKNSGNSEIMSEWYVLGIKNDYKEIRPEMKAFLTKVGRRKYLEPLYTTLASSEETLEWGREVYKEARPNYHAISFNTVDEILFSK